MGIIGVATALLLSAGVAFAEESAANTEAVAPRPAVAPTVRPSIRPEVKKAAQVRVEAVREDAKALMEAKREEAKTLLEKKREEAKNLIKTRREEAKTLMEAKREEAKKLLEAKREEAKVRVEAMREKAEKRLGDIKDKAKQETAQRLAKRLEELNSTWTDRFMQNLDRHVAILQKIRDRADIAASAGKDTAAATTAIDAASASIESARAAVIAQAGKTYVLDASAVAASVATTTDKGQSELMKNLKAAFQKVHKALFADLYALRDGSVADARKAVQNALQELGKIPSVNEGSATTTAATANQ